MKIKSLLSFGLISVLGISNTVVNQKPSFSQEMSKFLCAKAYEADHRGKLPATVLWVAEQKKNVVMIYWKSEKFKDWSPEERCETVSPKIDQAFREGRLNYITYGKVNNLDVICAVAKQGQICNSNNQLFTISTNQDSQKVEELMEALFQGIGGPVYQSGDQRYIEVDLSKIAEQKGVEIEK